MLIENSVEHFWYSGTAEDECVCNWKIKNFSMHAHKGCRTSSPVFQRPSGSQWCLILCVEEVSVDEKYEEFITVHLENRKCDKKQFVKVKLSICDLFGKSVESKYKEVLFDGWTTSSCQKVFSISKDYVMNELMGLNRMLLVPNDVCTLRCEMTITEESPAVVFGSRSTYNSKCEGYDFENNLPVLWFTRALLLVRPALFRGKEGILFVYKVLQEVWIYAWPIIVFLAPIVFRIVCFILILCKDLICWSYKKYTTPKIENTTVAIYPSAYGQRAYTPRYVNTPKYVNNRPQNYIVKESDMQRLFDFLSSQPSADSAPRALKGVGEYRKHPKLTYNDDYY